ncbi:MAG: hypothetical protein C4583_08260 [Anaerolineaceae bacterium]|nr:MAG: hypothetical protein C4583_08260 [Anaerolineaceae bacterium]
MYTLGPEEKASLVMAYLQTGLVRGEIVTRDSVRINTWLRTDSAPDYIHFHNSQWLQASAGTIKSMAYNELLLPVSQLIGFHPVPPTDEPLDYNPREDNRINKPVLVAMGLFMVKGFLRTSAQTDLVTNLQITHSPWLSIYEAEISSPQLPQMPPLQVPMLLVRPMQVVFVPQN